MAPDRDLMRSTSNANSAFCFFLLGSVAIANAQAFGSHHQARSLSMDAVLMIEASAQGNIVIVRAKVEAGEPISGAEPKRGATALHCAAANGHRNTVAFLIGKGAETNASDANGATPLVYAAYSGHVDVVRDLLDAKANSNVVPTAAPTPLVAALQSGSARVVRLLVANGADPDLSDAFGVRPRQFAHQLRVGGFNSEVQRLTLS